MYLRSLVTVSALALSASALAQHGPYAGEQQRAIKSLSEKDIAELQAGQGWAWPRLPNSTATQGPPMCWSKPLRCGSPPRSANSPKRFLIRTRPLRATSAGNWWKQSGRWTLRLRANVSIPRV